MNSFLQALAGLVVGVLNGYDRLVFRGHLREFCFLEGMQRCLNVNGVLLKAFKQYAEERSQELIAASQAQAQQLGRPIEYLSSPKLRKEDHARRIAQRDHIRDGLIAVFTCVEPCSSFGLRGCAATKKLVVRPEMRKCLHLYHYYQHPVFGFCYARVQSWFPFTVQIGLNGREWLSRQLDQAGLDYRRADNCLTWVKDLPRAQQLFDAQLRVNWPKVLEELRVRVHPAHPALLGNFRSDYYWSLTQSEWASDVLFEKRSDLQARYGAWLRHAVLNYPGADVLRFLGRKLTAAGAVHGKYAAEVLTHRGRRVDGVRIKHQAGRNSIKMYDKAGQVLRVETTINDPRDFKVYRAKANDPAGEKAYRRLRSGVADLHRRAQVSQAANDRYLASLAATQRPETLQELIEPLGQRVKEPGAGGRRVRGLNPLAGNDAQVLAIAADPAFVVHGLRNRDLVARLHPRGTNDPAERKRRSGQATRWLRLLRAHGILKKVPKTHRYQVTERGRSILTALQAARQASSEKLLDLAA